MKNLSLNLSIIDNNPKLVTSLLDYLHHRYNSGLNISTFNSVDTALKKIDKETNIVILDYNMEGEKSKEVVESIKKINPKTEILMLACNEDMGTAIDAIRGGAMDIGVRPETSIKKIYSFVCKVAYYPVKVLVEEFGVSKFVAIFLLTFVAVGIAVFLALRFFP